MSELAPMSVQSASPSPATSPPSEVIAFAQMIERVARDSSIDIDRLDRLLVMRERENARRAEQAWKAAMSAAQAEMEPIRADAKNDQTHSRYASHAALDGAIRSIYTGHGFGLTFDSGDAALPDHVRIICDVSHPDGHSRRYHLDMPVDGKGARGGDVMTKTHAMGSGITYGKRYLLGMIFNLAVTKDDDGNAAGGKLPARIQRNLDRIAPKQDRQIWESGDLQDPRPDLRRASSTEHASEILMKLQTEIDAQPTVAKLEAWGFANEQRFLALSPDQRDIVTHCYQERLKVVTPALKADGLANRAIAARNANKWDGDGLPGDLGPPKEQPRDRESHRAMLQESMEPLDCSERDTIPAFCDRRRYKRP